MYRKRLGIFVFFLFLIGLFSGVGAVQAAAVVPVEPNDNTPSVFIEANPKGGYTLRVNQESFLIKGVIYHPVPPGHDHSYDFWQDLETIEKDAKLMREAGFNAVRFYTPSDDLEQTKKVIQVLYDNGIYTIMSHWLGFWNYPAPFYGNEDFQQRVKADVLEMVESLKDEPGLLMWILGNENNYSFSGKVNPWPFPGIEDIECPSDRITKRAEIYYEFVNDIAKEIKNIDKKNPVGLGNGELNQLDVAAQYAEDFDYLALISYRGKNFGNVFNSVKYIFDKPVLMSEMGCDAYDAFRKREDQSIQADFLLSQWKHLYQNTTFWQESGNCIGGMIFEWNDEWWKHNPSAPDRWEYHDTAAGWSNAAYYFDIKANRNLNMNEEWFGITRFKKIQEAGYIKEPRKAYYTLKEFFNNPEKFLGEE
jgi:beta-galactosidase/beta-glucuronidase